MIYFLDNSLQLQKIVTSKNVISAIHEHELNGLIRADVELDLSYANKFLILGIDHVGYYYKDEFYLHKIQRVEYDHVNETATVVLRHIFFEDMIFGKLIQDVRPQNQDALTVSRQTIDANTRWQTIMTDVTGRLSTNFYWQVPYEVIEFMTENYRIEYLPKILFDGEKINGFELHLANKIGEDKNIRIPYGSRVLDLKYEEDYSEIITKLVVHGKGEEVGDGYGRRINISDVNFSRNGVESPIGSLYLEDESITNTYGNDGQTPREGREVFEDIENVNELAEAGYQHYLQVSRPQMLFTADVADIGDVGIGDSVMIIRREYDVYFNARIHKLSVDLLYPEDAQVELGDYKHFKESKIARKTREKNNQLHKRNQSLIEQAKRDFDERFNSAVEQFRSEFEQAKIDIFAEIEADRIRMEELIETTRRDWTAEFNEEMEAAYEEAQKNYTSIENRITKEVDGARRDMEQGYTSAVEQALQYAEEQATEKANAVQSNLENVTNSHKGLIDALERNVLNIDTFIGSRDRTLDEILNDQRIQLEQKIEVYNRNYPNLVIGSTLENIDGFEPYLESEFELRTNESLNYIRTYPVRTDANAYYYPDTVYLEQGKTYTLAFDFRSDVVKDLDYVYFMGPYSNVSLDTALLRNFEADGTWHRYYVTFAWVNTTRQARLMVGTNFNQGDMTRGWFDTRQIHVYEGETQNIPWSPSPSDNAQIVSQLLFEMRQLEDGMSTLATRTDLDLVSGRVEQFTNEFTTTSEQLSSKLQRYDEALGVNGSHFTQIAEQVQSKVWLNDITTINPNLIPFADVSSADSTAYWTSWNAANITSRWIDECGEYVIRSTSSGSILGVQSETFDVIAGEELTFSMVGRTSLNWNSNSSFSYTYLVNESGSNQFLGSANEQQAIDGSRRRSTWRFSANFTGKARILIGTYRLNANEDARFSFKEPKLERGSERTPVLNAFSNIEQLANKIALQVQDLDGEYLSESDLQITPNYWQLGATRIGPENVSSVLRGSPDAIDAIVSKFNLTGNLNVKGQIETISMSAIKAEFADLFAARVRAGSVHADYVEGFAGRFSSLYTLNANIERLVAQNVFTDAVTTKSLDAIEANIGRVRTAFLTSNVIESEHIQVGTALVHKLFAASARIDELITKSHFVNNVKAMSIEAVEGQFSSLMTKYFSANYIDVDYIVGKNAWFETQYTSNAMIRKLTAQTAFIRDVQAIEITANQLNIQTLHSKLRSVEGGLTIYGPDGRVLINNSMLRASFDVQVYDAYGGNNVEFAGLNYYTSSSFWQTFKYFYTDFKGSQLLVSWAVGLQSGNSASEYAEVQVRGFGGNNPIGSRSSRQFVKPGETTYHNQIINLGVPDYSTIQGYLEFRRSPTGVSMNNTVYARILRVSLIN